MNISRASYDHAARRVGRVAILVFPAFGAVGLLVTMFVGLPFAAAVRDLVGGNAGMAGGIVLAAPFALMPVLLPWALMVAIDRRIGIRCPVCGRSLTARCMPEKVLITRRCSNCNATVLLDDEFKVASARTKPFVVLALVVLAVLGIGVAIALHAIDPANNPLNLRDELLDIGLMSIAVLAIGCIQSAVIKIMKRRWNRESIIDCSKRLL